MKNQDKFMNILELTALIKKYSKKLEKGSINLSELTSFLEVSRELNERIIILRYKLMEHSTIHNNIKTVGEMNSMIERKNNEINEEFISKDQTNLFDAINQQEITENGYEVNESNSHLSFGKLLFDENQNEESSKSEEVIDDMETEDAISFDIETNEKLVVNEGTVNDDVIANSSKLQDGDYLKEVEIPEPYLKTEEITEENKLLNNDEVENQSINEVFSSSSSEKKTLVDELTTIPIEDLEKSISLNQKFIFINDLFHGESMVYNEIINQLNTQENLKRALEILRATGTEYEWPVDGNPALNSLYDLVERRYKNL